MKFRSYNLEKHGAEIENAFFKSRIFWARIVSHENESLLTQYTKHTFYEIQYALDGHIGMKTDGDNRLYIAESDFAVIPPDTYHQVVDADSEGARFIMAFSIDIKDPRMKGALKQLGGLTPHKETASMRALLSLIFEKNASSGFLRERNLSNLLESFLFEMLEAVYPQKTKSTLDTASSASKANEILGFIKSCNGIGIRVSDLSKKFNMSERHIGRILVAETGKSPKEAIDHEKLKKIEEYIGSTGLSLCEISELCGFCDEYAMNKFFKRQTMMNLRGFQKLARRKGENKLD